MIYDERLGLYPNFKNIFHQVLIDKKLPQLSQNLQFVTVSRKQGLTYKSTGTCNGDTYK